MMHRRIHQECLQCTQKEQGERLSVSRRSCAVVLRNLSALQMNSMLLRPITIDNVQKKSKIGSGEFMRLRRICVAISQTGTSRKKRKSLVEDTESFPVLPVVIPDQDRHPHGRDMSQRKIRMRLFGQLWKRSWQEGTL
jgi:hypothetical protein